MAKKVLKGEKKRTPLMTQYYNIKNKYKDAILLFRVGDFYETFEEDAVTISKVLGITLTKRGSGSASEVDLAGFPYHSLDTYLPRLVRAGYRTAICDQLEDPKKAKKLVKRGVTELVTPGVAMNDKLLEHNSNNYLASVSFNKTESGVAFLDISTGEFLVAQGPQDYVEKLIQSFNPAETILSKNKKNEFTKLFGDKRYTYPLDEWVYNYDYTFETLLKHFNTASLKGFGIQDLQEAIIAAGAIIHYLQETQNTKVQHISSIARLVQEKYVWLDRFTIRNLELVYSTHESGIPLIKILDRTVSPMGARLMKKWVVLPMRNQSSIENRLDLIEYFMENQELSDHYLQQIKQIGDLERLIAKVPMAKINPREVVQLRKSLLAIRPIKALGIESKNERLKTICDQLNVCQVLCETIAKTLVDEPPVALNKGRAIRAGVSEKLDSYKNISENAKEILESIKKREVERTGISSLKIGFNNVFGYYLEVTNKYKKDVPPEWIRKQTLTNAERYITEELKEYEHKILHAEEKMDALEAKLYQELVLNMIEYIKPIQLNSQLIARIDCLLSLMNVALKNNYCKPVLNDSLKYEIKGGRHPVIEQNMPPAEEYVPNDLSLDSESEQIMVITGPNMSGKSAILRQTALIVLMAQMGSYVPAQSAILGMTDKVFTRVGASDNISSGESTFMVEMNETASIMNNISPRSLILLDEIGRGTSTYDGISIAWSLAEYLHEGTTAQPKTLFATHYHELNELEGKLDRVVNYHVATKEVGDRVIFLRKLTKGGSHHSFGIHVAAIAGMPPQIVKRASEILVELEKKHVEDKKEVSNKLKNLPEQDLQMNLFSIDSPVFLDIKKVLESLDINTLTPIEAMIKLSELKKMLEE